MHKIIEIWCYSIIAIHICIDRGVTEMDWRSVKFDWNHARSFLVTAEEGSLSAAA
ncbi:MAG: hypothetical protein ACI9ES_002324, partial [Oceanospirillaceae bacterium]